MSEFPSFYEPTRVCHKDRPRLSPGNHEHKSSGAKPHYENFGENAGSAGRGYYSYDVGAWHVISLNSNISSGDGSAQVKWLREDLDANSTTCTIA